MLKRYIARRQNPWELLVVGALYFFPGLALFLHQGPALVLNARWRTMRPTFMSPGAAHVLGAFGMFVGVVCLVLYFYIRRANAQLQDQVSVAGASHSDELPLAYGSTRSPFPVFERLKFWRNRP